MKTAQKIFVAGIILGATGATLAIGGNLISASQAQNTVAETQSVQPTVETQPEVTNTPTQVELEPAKVEVTPTPVQTQAPTPAPSEVSTQTEVQNPVYINPRPVNKYTVGQSLKIGARYNDLLIYNPEVTQEEADAIHNHVGTITQSFEGEFKYVVSVDGYTITIQEALLY